MRGSSQSQLILGSDGNLWVVKFQNNPEHIRILANEMIGTRIAHMLGLTVPSCAAIHISSSLIETNPTLSVHGLDGIQKKCNAGLHFGSRFVGGLMPGHVIDYIHEPFIRDILNLHEIPGMLAFDKWTCNSDTRQAVYCRSSSRRRYRAVFIDQGHCFNGGKWSFLDNPLSGLFPGSVGYAQLRGWKTFEPWLQRIEEFSSECLWSIVRDVPYEWYEGDYFELEQLMDNLIVRRSHVRSLIEQFRMSDRRLWTAN